jgi:hypothetical protein
MITLKDVEPLFEFPSKEAAKSLGISNNNLKRMCRRIGIERWPHRKIRSLKRLKKCVSDSSVPTIEKEIERIKKDPNSDVSESIKSIMSTTYKYHYKASIIIESIESVDESWMQCLNILLQDPPKTNDNTIEQPETPTQAKECWLTSKFVKNKPHVVVGASPILPLLSTSDKNLDRV